jgi:peptidoglycan/xylan/chitin deacetylase (PgdA/CDA1 family)
MMPSRIGTWALKRVLFHSGLLTLAGLARRRAGGLVLRYHAITPDAREVPYATPEICLPLAALRVQMAFVKRAYTVVSLDELVDRVGRGEELPPRALAITFDDGYADNHRLAFPVLQRLGLPATVYLTSGTIDGGPPLWMSAVRALVLAAPAGELAVPGLPPVTLGPLRERGQIARALTRALVPLGAAERDERLAAAAAACGVDPARELDGSMLAWDEVRELARGGWTIGAHTVTHVNVALAAPDDAASEIAASRDTIAAAVGAPVVHFAYPNTGGTHRYFDGATAGILQRLGFRSAVTSAPGLVRPGVASFALPRIGVGPRLAPVSELAATLVRQRLAA